MKFDVYKIRKDFPALNQNTRSGKALVYFDNAATAQKPKCVIDAVSNFYSHDNANIHRSAHELSARATTQYETSRKALLKFLNADASYTAVWTRGATEALNIVAQSWAQSKLSENDEILLSEMEHHANIVPWQIASQKTGAKIQVVKILPDGSLDMDDLKNKLSQKTKIVSITHASNVLGTINNVEEIGKLAHSVGAVFSIDAAQSAPHLLDDVVNSNADFLSLSAHKCYAPTGCGALIAKKEILDNLPPYQCGGDMIDSVSWQKTTFRPAPERFEAGTPNIAGAIGFHAAIDYLSSLDKAELHSYENSLLEYLNSRLAEIPRVKIYGTAPKKTATVSFSVDGVHPNDISVMLDANGIAIRTGHHCAEPLMHTLGVSATCRASLSFYNTKEEIDIFADSLLYAINILI